MFPLSYCGPQITNPVVCIPLKTGGSRWQDNELRFCLRSISKFWDFGSCPAIHLLTPAAPPWLNPNLIKVSECHSYADAVKTASNISSDFYVFWNDDIFLLKPTTVYDLTVARYMSEMTQNPLKGNKWIKKLQNVRDSLFSLGYSPVFNFSTHTPYLFNSNLMKHVILKFSIDGKTPLETAYFNIARSWYPLRKCDDKLVLNNGKEIPSDLSPYRFLNVFDKGLTNSVKRWLQDTFPEKSPYEL